MLEVIERNGKIEIGTAYENTMIIINNKTYVVTKSIKEVQCYLNEAGEIIAEYYDFDGVHLNGNGYAVWIEGIREYVE